MGSATGFPSDSLRAAWADDRPALGGWSMLGDPHAAEVTCRAGYDWLGLDMQHGLISDDRLPDVLRAAALTRAPVLVRTAWNDPAAIMRALDSGACGVIVPMVSSGEEAARAVRACRYPPLGERSWGPTRAALGIPAYSAAAANAATLCFAMIESREGFENLDEIASTPALDGLFVGPMDLALSHGETLSPTAPDPAQRARIARIAEVCATRGLVAGIYCGGAALAGEWARIGFRLLAVDADVTLLARALAAELEAARAALPR
ncbi:MAG TPA: aldolase/citrate lyase family protein [Gaiellaceae bacterium]